MATLRKFWKAENGNFAMMTAILGVPILMACGMAVDYINLSRQQQSLQAAIDSAALAVTREGPSNMTKNEAYDLAVKFVRANYPELDATVSAEIIGTDKIKISGKFDQSIGFGGFFGMKTAKVGATSTATYSSAKYEIAFVLDTTGSMEGGKLKSMQDAVAAMLDDISGQNLPTGTVKYAVVPYAAFVNVGPGYGPTINSLGLVTKQAASWIDQDAKATIKQSDLPNGLSRFAMFDQLKESWAGCVESRQPTATSKHDIDDTVPTSSDPSSLFTPMFAVDEPDSSKYPNSYIADSSSTQVKAGNTSESDKISRLKRYGQSGSYKTPLNLAEAVLTMRTSWKKVTIDSSKSKFYSNESDPKGPNYNCEVTALQPLTTDADKVKKMVNKLVANGSTNTVEGVMWGWRVLSKREPFTEGAISTDSNTIKTMIFLTDGQNSFGVLNNDLKSGYISYGYLADGRLNGLTSGTVDTTNAELNKKTLEACAGVKKDGIEVFSIRLEEPDVDTGTMLKNCASSPAHFFDAPSRTKLEEIFKSIKKDIMRVRLSS